MAFAPEADPPQQNFVDVALATNLVIVNSTFSYWAAYVAGTIGPGEDLHVVAPAFFSRSRGGRPGWELQPRWDIVTDIPGGWDGFLSV